MKRALASVFLCVLLSMFFVCAYADDPSSEPGEVAESLDPDETSVEESTEVTTGGAISLEQVVINANTVVLQSIGDPDDSLPDEPSQEIGQYGYSIVCNIPNVGNNKTLLIPANYRDNYFAVDDDGYLYNVSSSTITCYVDEYSVRFASYSVPQTRHTNASYNEQWVDSNVTYISSADVSVKGANTLWWSDFGKPLIIFAFLGVIVICLFIKH